MKITHNLNSNIDFNSSQLKIGEIMICNRRPYNGHILLKIHKGVISLTNPTFTWNEDVKFPGRKLLPGESVTLTQE